MDNNQLCTVSPIRLKREGQQSSGLNFEMESLRGKKVQTPFLHNCEFGLYKLSEWPIIIRKQDRNMLYQCPLIPEMDSNIFFN